MSQSENMRDDPYRVAPPYCAPGEVEPPDMPDPPEVTLDQAVSYVLMTFTGKRECAFGDSASQWEEVLMDDLVDVQDKLLVALLADRGDIFRVIGNELREKIQARANDWLTNADIKALVAEDFIPEHEVEPREASLRYRYG